MKRILFLFLALCTGFLALAQEPVWRARWISKQQSNSGSNEWIAFRKRVNLDKVPQSLPARIAADTKYWLWINGELAVYEGGLKRGPAPGDGYVDTVDIAPWLRPGENLISILVWHLGRNGFSHLDPGKPASSTATRPLPVPFPITVCRKAMSASMPGPIPLTGIWARTPNGWEVRWNWVSPPDSRPWAPW